MSIAQAPLRHARCLRNGRAVAALFKLTGTMLRHAACTNPQAIAPSNVPTLSVLPWVSLAVRHLVACSSSAAHTLKCPSIVGLFLSGTQHTPWRFAVRAQSVAIRLFYSIW